MLEIFKEYFVSCLFVSWSTSWLSTPNFPITASCVQGVQMDTQTVGIIFVMVVFFPLMFSFLLSLSCVCTQSMCICVCSCALLYMYSQKPGRM